MKSYTLADRAGLYNQSRFGKDYPDSQLRASDRWLSGQWVLGNDYRGSGMYGSYPPSYLKRVGAIFPDATSTVHLFSGSLPTSQSRARGITVDMRVTALVRPGVQGLVTALPFVAGAFDLGYADPPYSAVDAKQYDTPMVDRRRALYEAHRVIAPGGFLVWLDTVLPMYRKDYWHWCGAIAMWRSSNHRVRGVHIFRRVPAEGEIVGYDEEALPLLDGVDDGEAEGK